MTTTSQPQAPPASTAAPHITDHAYLGIGGPCQHTKGTCARHPGEHDTTEDVTYITNWIIDSDSDGGTRLDLLTCDATGTFTWHSHYLDPVFAWMFRQAIGAGIPAQDPPPFDTKDGGPVQRRMTYLHYSRPGAPAPDPWPGHTPQEND